MQRQSPFFPTLPSLSLLVEDAQRASAALLQVIARHAYLR